MKSVTYFLLLAFSFALGLTAAIVTASALGLAEQAPAGFEQPAGAPQESTVPTIEV